MSYQYETQFDSPNYTPASQVPAVFGRQRSIDGFTYHWWGDPNTSPTYEGVISWLSRPGGNSSAHYVLETGRVACIVSPLDAAWHAGNALGNATTIGIEMNPLARDGDYTTVAEFSAQLIDAFGDQLKYRHSDWVPTQCPGTYDIDRIDRESYLYDSGAEWGDVTPKGSQPPTPSVTPPEPTTPPIADPEWIRNLKDITPIKLSVLPAEGMEITNLVTMEPISNQIIPRGTQIDIIKETTVGGYKFYISSWAASKGAPNGLLASNLGIPVIEPENEKPEWLSNLEDIEDKDFWTRSNTPVLKLADGTTTKTLPVNTKVRVTHSTQVVGINLLVLEGQETAIETVYLSDTPMTNPGSDLEEKPSGLWELIKKIISWIIKLLGGKK